MSSFIIPEIVNSAETFNGKLFPLPRAAQLERVFAEMFSRHLGNLRGGDYFESEVLVVTGKSGAGKSTEIMNLLKNFNTSGAMLPTGQPARMVACELNRKDNWKVLGQKTLTNMRYPVSDRARLTQPETWARVVQQGAEHGVIGINYDEMQHILAKKSEEALEAELDSFKSILKSKRWPFLLILSGLPEINEPVRVFEQLCRKVTYIHFEDIDYDKEEITVQEIVTSYAMKVGLQVDDDLNTRDFIHRLTTAAAFRWGLVCEITTKAVERALVAQSPHLTKDHFVDAWVMKTNVNRAATPFTHDNYATLFRREQPFHASLTT